MGLSRACALSIVFIGMAGCGGGSGGGSGSGGGAGPSTTIAFTFSGPKPTAVAARIGSGSFALQPLSSGTLLLSVPSGTSDFAVAFACPPVPITANGVQLGQTLQEFIFEATPSDGTSFSESCPPVPPSFQTGILTGSVDASAIPGASFLTITAQSGDSSASTNTASPATNFSLSAPAGIDRVEVLAFQATLQGGIESTTLLAARNFNNQTVPGALNDGNPIALSAADETTAAPIAYNNVPAGFPPASTAVLYDLAGGGVFLIAEAATDQYPVLPAGATQPGDLYAFQARARNLQGNSQQNVSSWVYRSPGGPMSFTFPAPWSYAGPVPAALPIFTFDYTGFAGKASAAGAAVGWWTGSFSDGTMTEMAVSVNATPNRVRTTSTIAISDLSHLAGFLPNPPSGAQASWSAVITTDGWSALQNGASTAAYGSVQNAGLYTVP